MKRYKSLVWIVVLLHCSSPQEDANESPLSSDGFHFFPPAGVSKIINVIKSEAGYTLYYQANEGRLSIAQSDNLIHWEFLGTVKGFGEDFQGDVVLDSSNRSGLSSADQAVSFIFFDDGSIKADYSLDNLSWAQADINVPAEIRGNPTISWHQETQRWIMTVASENDLNFLSSTDLLNWTNLSALELPFEVTIARLLRLGTKWILNLPENAYYSIGSFDGTKYTHNNEYSINEYNLFQLGKRVISIENVFNETICMPKEIQWRDDSLYLNFFPVTELKDLVTAKRRSRLNNLKGDKASWFHFEVPTYSSLKLTISNHIRESVLLFKDPEFFLDVDIQNSSKLNNKGQWNMDVPPEKIEIVDILIDYNVVEIFLNNGESYLTILVYPNRIYDKITLEIDGDEIDVPSILYSINNQPAWVQ